jgi:hypothetical protein
MIVMCNDCDQALGEECGDTGVEIYGDSYCGSCSKDECKTCKYVNCCPVDSDTKTRWGFDENQ